MAAVPACLERHPERMGQHLADCQPGHAVLQMDQTGEFPDMLTVGLGELNPTEQRFRFSLWAINKSPLIMAGTNLPADSKAVLSKIRSHAHQPGRPSQGGALVRRHWSTQWDINLGRRPPGLPEGGRHRQLEERVPNRPARLPRRGHRTSHGSTRRLGCATPRLHFEDSLTTLNLLLLAAQPLFQVVLLVIPIRLICRRFHVIVTSSVQLLSLAM